MQVNVSILGGGGGGATGKRGGVVVIEGCQFFLRGGGGEEKKKGKKKKDMESQRGTLHKAINSLPSASQRSCLMRWKSSHARGYAPCREYADSMALHNAASTV